MWCALLALLTSGAEPVDIWYGPALVRFDLAVAGNPFDPEENDVRVIFTQGERREERLAAYDGDGRWFAVLRARAPGEYLVAVTRGGATVLDLEPIRLDATPARGLVRRRDDPRRLWRDGRPYFPIGFNLGWQNPGLIPLTEQIAKMARHGVNWTRIWACHWDGKNPWFRHPGDAPEPAPEGHLWMPALRQWDAIVAACETHDVPMQFVLFHHGAFSSRVNPNWPEHPWNAKNGGFLEDAADFFTHEEARRRAKLWLRTAVARWGHSPGILAWELFNEVEWVDARYADRWDDIARWHDEMAAYLREIDPYGRLVTTSSELHVSGLWRSMDFYQPHTYPANVFDAIAGTRPPSAKPLFFGEFGGQGARDYGDEERAVLRDGLWAGVFGGHAGAGQYWFWDRMEHHDLYGEFDRAARVLAMSGLAHELEAEPLAVRVETSGRAPIVVRPGLGWEATRVTALRLPQDARSEVLAGWSMFLQGSASPNAALFPEPLRLYFRADRTGRGRVLIQQIARAGASLRVSVNGEVRAERAWPADERDRPVREWIDFVFPAGENEIELRNEGADWLVIGAVEISDLVPDVTARALGHERWLLLRLTATGSQVQAKLSDLGLHPGRYALWTLDLNSGQERKDTVFLGGDPLSVNVPARDVIAVLQPHEE